MQNMTIGNLERLRNEYSDEIPDTILHGRGKTKVRRNWWHGLLAYLEQGLNDGTIPKALTPEVFKFINYYTSSEFHYQPLTTSEDIQKANALLDKVLKR